MAAVKLSTDFSSLSNSVHDLFMDDHAAIQPQVEEADQRREISLLKETLGGERFFFIIDMLSFEIAESYGVGKWLGYPDNEFTMKFYWENVVHNESRKTLMMMGQQLYGLLCRGTYKLQFMVQRYSSLVALRHRNGNNLLVKKTASVFQYDDRNRLLAYLNEFTIIGEYNGEPLEPRLYNSGGERESQKELVILQQLMERFIDMKVFSAKELQVARKLAYNPGITQTEIALQFNVSKYTIDTYYKRFLEKARNFYNRNFVSALEAATHLRKEGLL